jgi:hypothetical protein
VRLPSQAHILTGVVIANLVACYHPNTLDCTVECAAATECAGGQKCKDGWCVAPNVECDSGGNPVMTDAALDSGLPLDADDSAQRLCAQGCSKGTCDPDGVCVIDCSAAGTCSNDVACPANLPCRVVCGDNSCGSKILCSTASSCEVQCIGTDACNDEIQCPAGECSVMCSGASSCEKRTKCSDSCTCDVSCTGALSCKEASECPMFACKVGNGCSSIPTGCNTCN